MRKKLIIFTIILLILDQSFKIWVKTHMSLGESYTVFSDWFKILFVENNGMAFGIELGGVLGKYALSLFRILAIGGIGWYILNLIKKGTPKITLYSFALIFTGAIGNIIDSLFYGILFNASYGHIATMFPKGGGYSSFLQGKVVDMLYFPLVTKHLADGSTFIFFRPVFNLADSYISIGVGLLILSAILGIRKKNSNK